MKIITLKNLSFIIILLEIQSIISIRENIFNKIENLNSNSNEICQKIKCGKTSSKDKCIEVNTSTGTSTLQECPSNQICDIPSEDPTEDAKCINKDTSSKKMLPSLPCDSNSDCYSGVCTNGVCIGVKEGDICSSATQCEYGFTCRKDPEIVEENIYKCLEPIKVGGDCVRDTDCTINSGCLKGKCTFYFSLDNGKLSREYDQDYELTFCKSGYSDELGICTNFSLANEVTKCSESSPCSYKDQSSGKNLIIPSNCLCGYNPEGLQYCLIGPGNNNYTKYLQNLQNYHLNNDNCHLSERTATGCQKDLIENKKETIKQIHHLINSKYWAKANNRLINTPECVFSIELPDYDRSIDKYPEPEIDGNCAIYTCKSKIKNGGYCASSLYEDIFNIQVELADICSDHKKCKIGGDPNEVFYNNSNIDAKCYENVENNKRYPGEKCEVDTECVYPLNNTSSQFHKCKEGRCNGMELDGICEDNTWCIAGYFCDPYSGKCKEQLGEGEKCLETKNCQNNLLCIDNKCSSELFSFADGKNVPTNENRDFQQKFCKSGEVFNGKCVSYNDLDDKIDDNEYKKCNFGTKCKYKINGVSKDEINVKEIFCPCGFNDQGQGYCPHFHEYNKNDWDDYRNVLKTNYDNECHTENRYNCYNLEEVDKIKSLKNKLEKGHLFYKSVDCANKVLKSSFIESNIILLALSVFVILF